MRSIRITLVVIIAILCNHLTIAQSPESDELTYKAYLNGGDAKTRNEIWKKAVTTRQLEFEKNTNDKNARYKLALAQFGLLTSTMRTMDEELFDEFTDKTETNLEKLKGDKWAEPKALLASLYGLQMGYSPWKGMYLGSKSSSLMDKAKKENPASPLVWKLYGNSKFHTPEAFGGDINEAIKAYEKAIQLYEADAGKSKNNWLYIDTMAFLGQAYIKVGELSKAIAVYEKALTVEPEFGWVKFSLLPAAMKKK